MTKTTANRVQDSEPGRKPLSALISVLFILAFGGAYLAVITPVVSTLAVRISQISTDQAEASASLGWITGVGALIAVLVTPIFGMFSDRTTSRWGRRRPWLFAGAIGTLISLVFLGLVGDTLSAALLWWVTQLFYAAVTVALNAFLPDWVPEHQRAKVGAWVGIAQQCVPLIGIYVAQFVVSQNLSSVLLFLIPGTIGMLFVIVFAVAMPDKRIHRETVTKFQVSTLLESFWFSPKKHPDFGWAWLGRFTMSMMFAFYATYQLYFIMARFSSDLGEALALQLFIGIISVVIIAVAAQISGWWSDRTGRRKGGVYLGSFLFVIAMVVHAFAYDMFWLWVGTVIVNIAIGVYFAVDLALVTDVLPDKETRAANGMGIFNVANSLPNSLAPFAAPLVLAIGGTGENYVALWLVGAGFALIASITVSRIRSVR
ncbi:MFS transporter [Microbacterium sp. ISL-103]|uniref:MFS transporter n=1 Tax=Microbacterium sp. ISL-103 TaxID=2819156 RepID=UPI001BEC6FEB|nr:MFS transporter [Microbacterium sp. ISL-103]MBT2474925.1 MFS transporter [Microbacterium sp. ISL-103]